MDSTGANRAVIICHFSLRVPITPVWQCISGRNGVSYMISVGNRPQRPCV